jgi:hypothetical protein
VEKMNEQTGNKEAKKPGTPSEMVFRQKVSSYADEIINKLVEQMRSNNPNVALGAAKTLLNKILPDLKSVEVGGALQADGTRRSIELFVNLGGGFVPPTITLPSASTSGVTSSTGEVQDVNLAPESTQDLHSNNGDSEAGAR